MSKASFVTFKNHAGWMVRGTTIMVPPTPPNIHMQVVAYITAQIETGGKFGTVQSYDGAGMSAGLLHNVAVLPASMEQGDLWALLAAIRKSGASLNGFGVHAAKKGWVLSDDGVLSHEGKKVSGEDIRLAFVGSKDGNGPETYTEGKVWAEEFADLFSSPATFAAQVAYAVRWLTTGKSALENQAYDRFAAGHAQLGLVLRSAMPVEFDLAMCVYHSFSVNAPSPAATILTKALDASTDVKVFAKDLITRFGKSDFARWHDDPDDKGSRYDATRVAIEKSGFWPKDLVTHLMPRNLP